jgi:hypothetical protein
MDADALGLPGAQRVALLRVLDLNHLGAEIAELEADHIARYEPRHLDYPHPVERPGCVRSKDFPAMLSGMTAPARLPKRIDVVGLAFGHAATRLAQACDDADCNSD